MLKQLIGAAALVLATGQALAHDYHSRHGHAVTVEPSISFSVGGRHDGVGISYHSGGRYWYDAPRYPVHIIGAPVYHHYYAAPHHHGHKHHHRHDRHDRHDHDNHRQNHWRH